MKSGVKCVLSKNNKVTRHAKLRFLERSEEPKDRMFSLSRSAMRKGLVWQQIQAHDPIFMKSKEGKELKSYMFGAFGRKKKYYKDYIYIFPKTSKRLITVFPVNEKFNEVLDKYWLKIYKGK